MASPDTIVLLIVDYDAAIGGPRPRAPNAYAPNALPVGRDLLSDFPYFLVFFFFSSFFCNFQLYLCSRLFYADQFVVHSKHNAFTRARYMHIP